MIAGRYFAKLSATRKIKLHYMTKAADEISKTVSVIVPVYNVDRYLARCLDSVLSQSHANLEVICVDDGSTDGSAAILSDYAARDGRIKIVTQKNGGLSAARNAGLDVMTGEYVMFVDSDDWIPQDAVAKFISAAVESGAPVVASKCFAKDVLKEPRADGCRWRLERPALKKIVGRRKMQSSVCNKFYLAKLLEGRRFIEGIYFEDWPFLTELMGDIDGLAVVQEPMYVYCSSGPSIVRSAFSMDKVRSYLAGMRHVSSHFSSHPMRRYAERRMAVAISMCISKVYRSGNRELWEQSKPALQEMLSCVSSGARALSLKIRFMLWRIVSC